MDAEPRRKRPLDAEASAARQAAIERDWWLRTLAVFQSPKTVFAALRDDSDEQAAARQEPLLALVWLAGIAGVLAIGSTTGKLLDSTPSTLFLLPTKLDGLEAAVFVFLAGGIYGAATYWLGGGALYLGSRGGGARTTYRLARHLLAYAFAPLALSLFIVWPLRLAVYGSDNFRSGGADEGAGETSFQILEAGFFAWALVLLVLGLRAVHGWSVLRAVGAILLAGLSILALAVVLEPSVVTRLFRD